MASSDEKTAASSEPMDQLREVSQQLVKSLGDKAFRTAGDKVSGLTEKLEGIADGGPLGKAAEKRQGRRTEPVRRVG